MEHDASMSPAGASVTAVTQFWWPTSVAEHGSGSAGVPTRSARMEGEMAIVATLAASDSGRGSRRWMDASSGMFSAWGRAAQGRTRHDAQQPSTSCSVHRAHSHPHSMSRRRFRYLLQQQQRASSQHRRLCAQELEHDAEGCDYHRVDTTLAGHSHQRPTVVVQQLVHQARKALGLHKIPGKTHVTDTVTLRHTRSDVYTDMYTDTHKHNRNAHLQWNRTSRTSSLEAPTTSSRRSAHAATALHAAD